MEIRDIALEAGEFFGKCTSMEKQVVAIALQGYFKGVADGVIKVGQSWVAEAIINGWSSSLYTKEAEATLLKIYSSGMCCEGQQLGEPRTKTFTERS